ncbi:MAG: riboflavin synthase [Halobacteriota archaeon]
MFTGIVETTGTITGREATSDGFRLRIETDVTDGVEPGASIAISGVCLTAETIDGSIVEVFLAEETRERTYLGELTVGDRVNVERPLAVDGRLDGHLVQGHVDATSSVLERRSVGEDWRFTFELPPSLSPYVVEKGSIAVDGISLTVADRDADRFDVAIIPETYRRTTLGEKRPGDPVHLEVDVIARYVERQLEDRA